MRGADLLWKGLAYVRVHRGVPALPGSHHLGKMVTLVRPAWYPCKRIEGADMNTTQAISQHIEALPEEALREVLDFVEFLESRTIPNVVREADATWSAFSLASAMRGMDDEPTPYTEADVKEPFG